MLHHTLIHIQPESPTRPGSAERLALGARGEGGDFGVADLAHFRVVDVADLGFLGGGEGERVAEVGVGRGCWESLRSWWWIRGRDR